MINQWKRGGTREEKKESTRRHTGTRLTEQEQQAAAAAAAHGWCLLSLSLLLLAPMYQIPALETHKPAQLPTSTPRLSFISPFSLMPSFSALLPHLLPSSDPLVVVLLPFVATTAMFPDSIDSPALATTSSNSNPPPSSPVCWGRRNTRSRRLGFTFDQKSRFHDSRD